MTAADAPAWRGWTVVVGGLALAMIGVAGAIAWGPGLPIATPWLAFAVFVALAYAPLYVVGSAAGVIEGVRAWRGGDRRPAWLAGGLAIGAGGFALALGYAWIAGPVLRVGGGIGVVALAGLLALTVFQVFAEELFFRGWLLASLAQKIAPAAALLLSAAAFAGFHLLGGASAPVSLVNLALGGLWFGLLAWRSGGLIAPTAAHFAWNAIEDSGVGLVPNPGSGGFGSVVDLDLAGAPIWGGGPEGLNASIGMSIALVALIVPLAWRPGLRTVPRVASP